ncbi:MAG TPA: hypothetical protein VMT69_13370 [Kineosporiaceae bacterium]|nr:hypothetical protein [Kineosporiaceae bacterium]
MQPPGRVERPPRSESARDTAEQDPVAAAWSTLRSYQDPDRYLRVLSSGTPGSGAVGAGVHPMLRPPSSLSRDESGEPETTRAYLAHSCDLTLRGGMAAAVTYPLAVCALAENYLVRRVGGASAAAVTAAAVAAAEFGRTAAAATPRASGVADAAAGATDPSPATARASPARTTARVTTTGFPVRTERAAGASDLPPPLAAGYAGLAQMLGWLAGNRDLDPPVATGGRIRRALRRDQHRLARMLQPSGAMRAPYRLLVATTRHDLPRPGWSSRRVLALAAGLVAAPGRGARMVATLVWAGLLLTWIGLTVALVRSPTVQPWVVAVVSPALLLTVLLAGAAITVVASAAGTRRLFDDRAAAEQYGLVPAVRLDAADVRRGGISAWLDHVAGVPDPAGLPPLFDWLTGALDDLAGLGRAGGDTASLTFGDLWLGRRRDRGDARGGRPAQLVDLLRRAAADPEHRVVDLRLVATDLTRGRPVQLPFGAVGAVAKRWLFCPRCLAGGLPGPIVEQMVAASAGPGDAAADQRCPSHGSPLLTVPEPWDVPVVVAVRMAAAAPGVLRAVPLYSTVTKDLTDVRDPYGGWTGRLPETGPDIGVVTHWFCGGGPADAPVSMFDTVLPRWPTFGLAVTEGFEARDDADGHWVEVPETSADPGPRPSASVTGVDHFVEAVRSAPSGWRDRAEVEGLGTRGRVAIVRRGAGVARGPFLGEQEILRLALRGHHAGRELRARFAGRDGDVTGQTGMDRHRWVRLRTALRDHRRGSLEVAARFPVYSDLAAAYRVPTALTGWFRPPLPPGRVDPAWADATAALTHLTSLTAGGVLDWDTDFGAPPPDSESPPT